MRKASAGMVQRGGGRSSMDKEGNPTRDRTSWPASYGHKMCNDKGFQYAANWLLQGLLELYP